MRIVQNQIPVTSSKKTVEGFERFGFVGPDESCPPEKYQIYISTKKFLRSTLHSIHTR